MKPEPGDVVELLDEFTQETRRGVIDSSPYPDGTLMVVIDASAFRPHENHVSCSGGPCPAVDPDSLELLGHTTQRFWKWKDLPRAGGGEDYLLKVRLWRKL